MAAHLRLAIPLACLLVVLGLGACGGDGEARGDGATEEGGADPGSDDGADGGDPAGNGPAGGDGAFASADVKVVAVDVDFPVDRFTAPAGEVTIAYRNDGRIRHTLVLDDVEGWETLEVPEQDAVDSASIELEPGEYTLFCDVPGHRQAGMEAVLVVEG